MNLKKINYHLSKKEAGKKIGEKCGIAGIYLENAQTSRLIHPALQTLQHRGQESSGIATLDKEGNLHYHHGKGLVASVYKESDIDRLPGHISIGHNRYSTSKSSIFNPSDHAQPVICHNPDIALAHNGNLPSTLILQEFLQQHDIDTALLNDSEMIAAAIHYYMRKGGSVEEAVAQAFPLLTGAFCLAIIAENKLVAVRDEFGIRPLSLGRINGGYIVASETCVFKTIGAAPVREINPGEIVLIDSSGCFSIQVQPGQQNLDIFEFIYFARPDSDLLGQNVFQVRSRLGQRLAQEHRIVADIVIPVPDSAIPYALGYSQKSGIDFGVPLVKNRYIHRTFIEADERLRNDNVALKLNPIRQLIGGQRVIIVDDSIVRGTTAGPLVKLLREAGAKEVHFAVGSPPVKYPDFYGIDTPIQRKLIAATMSIEKIRQLIGADSLCYISYEGLIEAIGIPEEQLCTSCFTGRYPIDIRERIQEIQQW